MTDPCEEARRPGPNPCDNARKPGPITEDDVKCAQREWCDGLLAISRQYPDGNYREAAEAFVRRLYDFAPGGNGRVYFRPTLAEFPYNFRTTFDGTVAYFVGGPGYPDYGFAKKRLTSVVFTNQVREDGGPAIQLYPEFAMALVMGNVCLTELDEYGEEVETVVDKTFAYRKDTSNNLRLLIHMSALRNEPGKPAVE